MLIYYRQTITATHRLSLPYASPCNRAHSHDWTIEVWIQGKPTNGIVFDYLKIKKTIDKYSRTSLNLAMANPTSENFAKRLKQELKKQGANARVRVWETDDCYAETDYLPN